MIPEEPGEEATWDIADGEAASHTSCLDDCRSIFRPVSTRSPTGMLCPFPAGPGALRGAVPKPRPFPYGNFLSAVRCVRIVNKCLPASGPSQITYLPLQFRRAGYGGRSDRQQA